MVCCAGGEAQVVREVFGRHFKIKLQYEDASRLVPRPPQGRDRSRTQTQNHRQDLHRSFPGGDQARRRGQASSAQGTLYPDVIESVPIAGNPAALIKSHHNVGGLPRNMKFKLIEPLQVPVQGRSAATGPGIGPAQRNRLAPALPRPRPGRAHPGRSHAQTLRHPARRRHASWSRK